MILRIYLPSSPTTFIIVVVCISIKLRTTNIFVNCFEIFSNRSTTNSITNTIGRPPRRAHHLILETRETSSRWLLKIQHLNRLRLEKHKKKSTLNPLLFFLITIYLTLICNTANEHSKKTCLSNIEAKSNLLISLFFISYSKCFSHVYIIIFFESFLFLLKI